MNVVVPACEILDLLYADGTCSAKLNHSIRHLLERGLLDEARAKAQQSIRFCTDMTNDAAFGRAIGLLHEAVIAHAAGDLENAHEYYQQARISFHTMLHTWSCWHEAVACLGLGLVAKAQRQWSAALRHYDFGLHTLARSEAEHGGMGWLKDTFDERIQEIQGLMAQQTQTSDCIPVVGKTAAGPPLEALEVDAEEAQWNALRLNEGLCGIKKDLEPRWMTSLTERTRGRYFAVAVEGDSMLNADIGSGDYVIFRQQSNAENGEIVVVLIDYLVESCSTVKRFYRRNGKIVLKADNPHFEPQEMVFEQGDPGVRILGKVVAIAAHKGS